MLGATRWRPHPLLGAKRSFPLEFSRATWCLLEPGARDGFCQRGILEPFRIQGLMTPGMGKGPPK